MSGHVADMHLSRYAWYGTGNYDPSNIASTRQQEFASHGFQCHRTGETEICTVPSPHYVTHRLIFHYICRGRRRRQVLSSGAAKGLIETQSNIYVPSDVQPIACPVAGEWAYKLAWDNFWSCTYNQIKFMLYWLFSSGPTAACGPEVASRPVSRRGGQPREAAEIPAEVKRQALKARIWRSR